MDFETTFEGLNAMINQPSDPHIIDMNKMALSGLVINQVITHIRYIATYHHSIDR